MQYVYIQSEPGLYTVGFHDPAGKWQPDSDHNDRQEAAKRTAWLNGAMQEPKPRGPEVAIHMPTPRAPTEQEIKELAQAYAWRYGDDAENGEAVLTGSWIAIFERYISDGPGYRGKVAAVIYPGGPEINDVYTWRNGEAQHSENVPY